MPRNMDWKDMIPARGEAEVSAKLKGAFGGKMRSNRYSGRNRRFRSSLDASRTYGTAVLDGTSLTEANNLLGYGNRVVAFNADTPSAYLEETNEPDAKSVSRILVQLTYQAKAATYSNGTSSQSLTGSISLAKAMFNDPNAGYQGYAPVDTNGFNAVGGIPLWLQWIYETYAEASESPGALGGTGAPLAANTYQKNRRIFRQEILIARQVVNVLKYDIKLPRVRLGRGDRETYQVSLVAWADLNATGIGSTDEVRMRGFAKAYYTAK